MSKNECVTFSGPLVVNQIISVLERVVANYQSNSRWKNTVFHALHLPPISLSDYIARLATGFACSEETLLCGLVYVMRIEQTLRHGVLCPYSAHRVILAAFSIALKFHEDVHIDTPHIASVGGVTCKELADLELELLRLLNFRALIPPGEFEALVKGLMRTGAQQRLDPLRRSY